MTSSLPNLRYERKFVAKGFALADIIALVKRHPAAFREVYPARVVNNIYLDSPARRDYHDHVNGTANRTKTRVRWYGSHAEGTEFPKLERKLKSGLVSGKEAHRLPPLSPNGDGLCSALESAFDAAALPPLLRSSLRHMEPALFNRYHRHYFLSGDRRFRLTVDSDLQFAAVPRNDWREIVQTTPAAVLIIELKFGIDIEEHAGIIVNAFSFRVARFSKYVAGVERVSAGHKAQEG